MSKEAIISNSSLNSYGFRVLTSGIDTKQFERNPIMLWMHNRASGRSTTDQVLPIGRIENLRVDGDNLIGTPVFDDNDDFAKKIHDKWNNGMLKMLSACLDIIECSEDPKYLLVGQTRATVTKSKLREVSIVDIGSNDDALALYHDGAIINLSDQGEIQLINQLKKEPSMKTIAIKLGLSEQASESDILAKIGELQRNATEVANLRSELAQQTELSLSAAVDAAIASRRITADKKSHFLEIGKKVGLSALNDTLNLLQPAHKTAEFIDDGKSSDTEYKTLHDVPADKLEKLRASDPAQYAKLYKAEYGIEPSKID